jgi:hypothetical protein
MSMDIVTAECSLAELVHDPLTGLVMKSDGTDPRELELLLERVARDRAGRINRTDLVVCPRLPTTETTPCSRC